MTVYALSQEYEQTAADLYRRIRELEQAAGAAEDEGLRRALEARARPLRNMYNDVRRAARELERYYDKAPGRSRGRKGRN